MKDLTPLLRRFAPDWKVEVRASESAVEQIRTASRQLGRSTQWIWRQAAIGLLETHRQFAGSTWFARQRIVIIPAINAGDPASHPEMLHPVRFEFLLRRGQPHWILGTSADFEVPRNYAVQSLLEEVRLLSDRFSEEKPGRTKRP